MKRIFIPAFFLISLLHLAGVALQYNPLIFSTKPLLMPALSLWLIASAQHKGEYTFFRRMIIGALAFSTLGDVLLMFSGELFFLLGLVFFLFAHLSYIGAFSSINGFKSGWLSRHPWWAVPFLLLPVGLLMMLWEGIPVGMKLPVAVYASVITLMSLSVLNLKGKISDPLFRSMLVGAVLFVLSDSLIAVSKFGQNFEGARIAVMLTYILGQFLLVRGAVRIMLRMD